MPKCIRSVDIKIELLFFNLHGVMSVVDAKILHEAFMEFLASSTVFITSWSLKNKILLSNNDIKNHQVPIGDCSKKKPMIISARNPNHNCAAESQNDKARKVKWIKIAIKHTPKRAVMLFALESERMWTENSYHDCWIIIIVDALFSIIPVNSWIIQVNS